MRAHPPASAPPARNSAEAAASFASSDFRSRPLADGAISVALGRYAVWGIGGMESSPLAGDMRAGIAANELYAVCSESHVESLLHCKKIRLVTSYVTREPPVSESRG